jgi:hypothetical protein
MQLKSNGGLMTINQRVRMKGYANLVWFSKDAITNILALSNVIKQYRVTYDSDDKTFIVHRQSIGLPDMEFWMHNSGLHYFRMNSHSSALSTGTKKASPNNRSKRLR